MSDSERSKPEDKVVLATRLALRPMEAARALGISERTLRQLAPELPVVRRGGVVLYPVEALRQWLDREARADGARVDVAVREALDAISR